MPGFETLVNLISWVFTPLRSYLGVECSPMAPTVSNSFTTEIHGRTLAAFRFPGAEPLD